MSKYIGFEQNIGSGNTFSLSNYYRLCEQIVSTLKEHESLLQKHFDRLDENKHHIDKTLHLLAFDLMYCSKSYDYYHGLIAPGKKNATDLKDIVDINVPKRPLHIRTDINGKTMVKCANCGYEFVKAPRCTECGQLQDYEG